MRNQRRVPVICISFVLSSILFLAFGCSAPPPAVQILEVSTLDYHGSLGASVRCSNTADSPHFFTLRIEFMDDQGTVKEIKEPYMLLGGKETETFGITADGSEATRVRCSIRNCSPQ